MNIGFYIDSLGETEETLYLFNELNRAVTEQVVDDASLFYNNVNFNPIDPKFGMFNSTDLWSFTGTLISVGLMNTAHAANIVNKFKLYHLFDPKERNLIQLLDIANRVDVVTKVDDTSEFKRLTGLQPVFQIQREFKVDDFKILETV